jgi:hypothetical protein
VNPTDQKQDSIPLMSEADFSATIANLANEKLQVQRHAAYLSRLAQQNAETADMANKAADSLSKQLKEALEKVAELQSVVSAQPTTEPAPGPGDTAEATPLPVIPELEPATEGAEA